MKRLSSFNQLSIIKKVAMISLLLLICGLGLALGAFVIMLLFNYGLTLVFPSLNHITFSQSIILALILGAINCTIKV